MPIRIFGGDVLVIWIVGNIAFISKVLVSSNKTDKKNLNNHIFKGYVNAGNGVAHAEVGNDL